MVTKGWQLYINLCNWH